MSSGIERVGGSVTPEKMHEDRRNLNMLLGLGAALMFVTLGIALAHIFAGPHETSKRGVKMIRDPNPASVAGMAVMATLGGAICGASIHGALYHHQQLKALRKEREGQELLPVENGQLATPKQPQALTTKQRLGAAALALVALGFAGILVFMAHYSAGTHEVMRKGVKTIDGPTPWLAATMAALAAGCGVAAGIGGATACTGKEVL
jgi:hypothetical protein